SGAYYVYVRRALGSYPSFVTGWGHWLALGSGAAWITLKLAEYLGTLIPGLADFKLTVAMLTVVGLALLQWRSVRWAGWIQDWTTLLKGLGFLALVVALFALGKGPAQPSGNVLPMKEGWALWLACVLAFQGVLQAYDGWEGAIYFGEE